MHQGGHFYAHLNPSFNAEIQISPMPEILRKLLADSICTIDTW